MKCLPENYKHKTFLFFFLSSISKGMSWKNNEKKHTHKRILPVKYNLKRFFFPWSLPNEKYAIRVLNIAALSKKSILKLVFHAITKFCSSIFVYSSIVIVAAAAAVVVAVFIICFDLANGSVFSSAFCSPFLPLSFFFWMRLLNCCSCSLVCFKFYSLFYYVWLFN